MLSDPRIEELFDEQDYLDRYSDIKRVVANGQRSNGLSHYLEFGHKENRIIKGFDPHYYMRTYKLVHGELSAGMARSAFDHYVNIGAARGYIPRPDGHRPLHAAGFSSPAGGFWPDLPNAFDLVQGKLDTGQITRIEADLFRNWIRDGYVILEGAIAREIVDRALQDFEKGYNGEFQWLRFECPPISGGRRPIPWEPEVNSHASKALDIHVFSRPIRDLIFSDPITRFLGLLFDSRTVATQSLGFWRGSSQEAHQDSAYVAYTLPRQFAASWIALEDVTVGAGELFYYPGSHKFEDFQYGGAYKSAHEARRLIGNEYSGGEDVGRHVRSLVEQAAQRKIEKKVFAAKKGDVLIWHADLVHGGSRISRDITRKSVVTHYCPAYAYPLYAELGEARLHSHNGHRFMSSHNPNGDPLD